MVGSTAVLELTYLCLNCCCQFSSLGWTSFANLLDLERKCDKRTPTLVYYILFLPQKMVAIHSVIVQFCDVSENVYRDQVVKL